MSEITHPTLVEDYSRYQRALRQFEQQPNIWRLDSVNACVVIYQQHKAEIEEREIKIKEISNGKTTQNARRPPGFIDCL